VHDDYYSDKNLYTLPDAEYQDNFATYFIRVWNVISHLKGTKINLN